MMIRCRSRFLELAMENENPVKAFCFRCAHYGFTDPMPPGGYGSNWWCKKLKKRITGKGCGGDPEHFRDAYQKTSIGR
jgi:hypothetical protein